MNSIILTCKAIFASVMVMIAPSWPVIAILLVAHLVDLVSAMMLNGRLRKLDPSVFKEVRFSSESFKKMIKDFGFEIMVLFLVMLIQHHMFPNVRLVVWVCYLMIGSQIVSICENSSEANGALWARIGRKLFTSKASRYIQDKCGVDVSDLFDKK